MNARSHLSVVQAGATAKTDDELMLLSRAGQQGAFSEIVVRHQRSVLAVARKHLGSADQAKDAAQNTFAELYRYVPERYRPQGRLKVLMFSILMNQIRQVKRSNRRSPIDASADVPEAVVAPIAEERLLRQERTREVTRAISTLSPKLQATVTLRFVGELSYKEISEVLEIPIGTVKSRLFQALADLDDELEGLEL